MSFQIKLQKNNSENNCVIKTLTDVYTLIGTLRDGSSITDPVFQVDCSNFDIFGVNYCTIETFHRSYFINNIVLVRTNLAEISCHVDVLSSFASEIKANKGIVRRQERPTSFNLYINDGSLVAYQNPYVLTEPFPNGFTGASFILVVAGGTSQA